MLVKLPNLTRQHHLQKPHWGKKSDLHKNANHFFFVATEITIVAIRTLFCDNLSISIVKADFVKMKNTNPSNIV